MRTSAIRKTGIAIFTMLLCITMQLNAQQAPSSQIKVHGHWTITVANPDGEVVKEVEFENALMVSGGEFLSQVLAGNQTPGAWAVEAMGLNDLCETADGSRQYCQVTEAILTDVNWNFETLTVQAPTDGDNAGALLLSGYFTAANSGDINRVRTRIMHCSSATTPDDCGAASSYDFFTNKMLETPVDVAANQQVTINVVISFS